MGIKVVKPRLKSNKRRRLALASCALVFLSSAARPRVHPGSQSVTQTQLVGLPGHRKAEARAYLEGLILETINAELIAAAVPTDSVAIALQTDFDDARFARDLAAHRERSLRAAAEHREFLRDEGRDFISDLGSARVSRPRQDRLPTTIKSATTSHSSSSGVRFGKLNIDLAFNQNRETPPSDTSQQSGASGQGSTAASKSEGLSGGYGRPVSVALQVPDTRAIELEPFEYESMDYIRKLKVFVALPAMTPFGSEGYLAIKIRRHPELNRYFEGEAAQGITVVRASGSLTDEIVSLTGSPRGARGLALVFVLLGFAGSVVFIIMRRRSKRAPVEDPSQGLSRSMAALYAIPEPIPGPIAPAPAPAPAVSESSESLEGRSYNESKEITESPISIAKMTASLGKMDSKESAKPGSAVYRRLILRLVATAELDDEAEIMAMVPPHDVALRRAMLKTRVFLKDVKFTNRRLLATALESVGAEKAAEFAVISDPETRAALREALLAMLGKDALARDIETRFGQIINDPQRLENVRRNRKIVALRVLDFITQALKSDEQLVEEIIGRQVAAQGGVPFKAVHKAS